MQPRPIHSVDECGELRSAQSHHAIDDRWPSEVHHSQAASRTAPDRIRPRPRSLNGRLASSGRQKLFPRTDHARAAPVPAPANPSAPLRKSTGLVAIRTRIPAGTVIICRLHGANNVPQPTRINTTLRMHHRTSDLDPYRAASRQPAPPADPVKGRYNRDKHRHRVAGQNQASVVPPCAKQTDAGD